MTDVDLSTCAICGEPALFTDSDPGANPVSYCSKHLPEHLATRAAAGQMPLKAGATKTALEEQARELDIEGRSTMSKTELEAAVAGAVAAQEFGDAQERPTADEAAELAAQGGETSEGAMTDAPVEVPEVHDHAVGEVEEGPKSKSQARRRSRS